MTDKPLTDEELGTFAQNITAALPAGYLRDDALRLVAEVRQLRQLLAIGKTFEAMDRHGIKLDQMGPKFRALVETLKERES